MASKKSTGMAEVSPSRSQYDYQCEEDVRTLTRAAEVLADRGRSSMAMKKFRRQNVASSKLVDVLAGNRLRGGTKR